MNSYWRLAFVAAVVGCTPDDRPVDRPTSTRQALAPPLKLVGEDSTQGDNFGNAVDLDGDTALVGARHDDVQSRSNQGSAYVFTRANGTWAQQGHLIATDGAPDHAFGTGVSLSGDTALVGAFGWGTNSSGANVGAAYVFVRSGSSWTQQQRLLASDRDYEDHGGFSVALSGNTALMGAFGDDSRRGAAYVFVRSGTSWTQQQKLVASDRAAGDYFGYSVALEGDTALIGAYQDDGPNQDQGSAYVFVRSGTTWTEQGKLVASDGSQADLFGGSVALAGETALIAAHQEDGATTTNQGAAYVFVRSGTSWTGQQKLVAPDGQTEDAFGGSVSVDANLALIGAYRNGVTHYQQGSAYLFERSGTLWTHRDTLVASDATFDTFLGSSVAISGETALAGSPGSAGPDLRTGAVYVSVRGSPHGTSCTTGDTCSSGRCVQNVCCSTECMGACESCLGAHTGVSDGTCSSVTGGTDPKNLCDDQGASSCGTTGTCGDAGACALYPTATPCGSPVCSGTTLKDQFCNGNGTCVPESGGDDCAPFTCSSGACDDPCGGDGECVAGYYCSSGACEPKGGTGTPCDEDAGCTDGHCVDDVCCESACDGVCEACSTLAKGSGDDGECEPVTAGGDPHDDCTTQAPETCGRTGACDGSGQCQLQAAGISCGTSMCELSTAKGQICDGDGMCVTSTTGVECAPHACVSGACRNPCTGPSDCLMGYVCVSGTCRQPGSGGTPCDDGSECTSGHCVDDVCCDVACAGSCVACSAETKGQGADGECGPIRATQDPDSECAAEDESTCGQNGQCNGAGACGRWAEGTECGPGSCSGASQTAPSTCDADGSCVDGAETACVRGYRCDGQTCATGCDDDSMCATGYVCDTPQDACVPEPDVTGGAGGEAGAPATGGTAGSATGGAAGSSGTVGEGGEATTPKPRRPSSNDDGGCGCRTAPNGRSLGPSLLGIATLLVVAARRRRRPIVLEA